MKPEFKQLRAALILLALIGNAMYALPLAKMKAEDLEDPEYRKGDIGLWYRWVGAPLGVEEQRFSRWIREYLWTQRRIVLALRAPFEPVFGNLHVSQQWGLFAVVTEAPDRLVVEVRRDGEWETLYRRLDGQNRDWHDQVLKYRRIRGVWDGVKEEPKGTYKRLCKWIALTVFDEQPDVDRVRVLLEKEREYLPWEDPEADEPVKRRAERYHRRGDL